MRTTSPFPTASMSAFAMLAVTTACTPELAPTDKSAVIEMTLSTPWMVDETKLYPDDVMTQRNASPVIVDGVQAVSRIKTEQLRNGTFYAVKAHILAHPLGNDVDTKECDTSEYMELNVRYAGPDTTRELSGDACQEGPVGNLWNYLKDFLRKNGASEG